MDASAINFVLSELNETGGEGVYRGGHLIPLQKGETPFGFAKRIAGGKYAIPTSKAAKAPSKAPTSGVLVSPDGRGAIQVDSRGRGEGVEEVVQRPEESLESVLEAKVATLRRSVAHWQGEIDEATSQLESARAGFARARTDCDNAERFLKEVQSDVSPEVRAEISRDIPGEAEDGESGVSGSVGEQSGTAGPSGSGEDRAGET